jgi:hypothetical protein
MVRAPVYVAVIGDLVGSRTLAAKQREKLQECLRDWLDDLNGELGSERLAAPLTLTAGDEIQGLFRKPSALVRVIQELTDRMFQLEGQPHALYGAGRGALSTGRIAASPGWAETPALLDGPAFHNARAALEHAQDEGGWVRFVGFGAPPDFVMDHVLDALFGLMSTIRESWTAKQGALSFRFREGMSQRALAEQMKISPSVVSEMLKASRHLQLVEGEEAARKLLRTLEP